MTLEEFEAMPVIMSFFPLTFSTGKQKWTDFVISCSDCEKNVPVDRTRGFVEPEAVGNYRATRVIYYNVVAHALCPKCNKLTTATYLLHEDMTFTDVYHKTGEYERWGMRKLTKWEKFVEFIRGKTSH